GNNTEVTTAAFVCAAYTGEVDSDGSRSGYAADCQDGQSLALEDQVGRQDQTACGVGDSAGAEARVEYERVADQLIIGVDIEGGAVDEHRVIAGHYKLIQGSATQYRHSL